MAEQRTTGWVGWIWFAAVMSVLVGAFNVIDGLVALFRDTLYVVGANELLAFDFTTWGWIHLIIGALQVIGGVALFGGRAWARALVCVLVAINAIAQLVFLPAFPVWSTLVIAVDVLILYAIIVHGGEVRGAMREDTGDGAGLTGGYSAGYTAGAAGGRHQAPEAPRDMRQDTRQDMPQGARPDLRQDMPQDARQDVPQDARQDVPQDARQNVPQGAPPEAAREVPQDRPVAGPRAEQGG